MILAAFSDKKLKAIPSLAIKARNELASASTDATTYNTSFEGKSGTHAVVYMRDFRKAIKKWNNNINLKMLILIVLFPFSKTSHAPFVLSYLLTPSL